MGLEVLSYDNHVLTTRAPLFLNTNIHDTAFAGSLYAIEAMTAWGVLYLEIVSAELEASIIHAHGDINFAKTIQEDIVAQSDFSQLTHCINELRDNGKTRMSISTQVYANDELASEFKGDYLARLDRTDQ